MASIYAKNGVYYLSWREGGKKLAISLKLKATRDNKKFALQYKLDKERELLNGSSRIFNLKLSEAIGLFLATKRTKEKNTIDRYKRSLEIFSEHLGDVYVNSITSNDLISYELKLSNTKISNGERNYALPTIESYMRDLRIFISFLRASKYIGDISIRKEKRTQAKHIVVIQDDKINEILNYFKSRNIEHYRYLKLLYLTGFRKGEALNLSWSSVDFNEKVIKLWNEKDNRNDLFPIFQKLEDFLLEFRAEGKMFNFIGSNHIAKILKREFNISFKNFRSTFATNKAKDFKSLELKELLRHKKVTTTEQYYVNIDVRSLGDRL